MKCCFGIFCVSLFLLIDFSAFSQSAKPSLAKAPSWIAKNEVDYTKTSLDKEATEGSLDISYEAQVSLTEHCKYYRRSKKILSQAGVQNESTISVSFDPSYQQLTFHTIQIMRSGEVLNRLQLSKIKTVHQETELSNFIYNGVVDAVIILDDVRPGDIIEFSYSIKGFNPVFKDKYMAEISTELSVPVYSLFYRLLVPKNRALTIKNNNETIQPVITEMNGQQVYEWRKKDVAPLVLQERTPSWYDPYASISISEFKSWKEVNDWSMELVPVRKDLSPGAQKKIAEIISKYPDNAGRLAAALCFVQDDVRYMGIEMGSNSHKPADPSKVFAQRFGDCKEKSYLLCCMLHAMNIEANPVLINTEEKKELNNMLPMAVAFNHMTVRTKLDGVYYWLDPTIAYQRGNVKELYYPDYQTGLVIDSATTGLTNIPFRNNGYQHVSDYFKVDNMLGGGTLVVTTTFKGDEADEARSHFNNESITEISKTNKKFYAQYYEYIVADSLTYTDDDSTGIFTSTEFYSIPNFWTVKDGVKKFSFSPFTIENILYRTKEKKRKMPLSLSFPISYKEEITIVLPEEWKISSSEMHLKNKGFSYNSNFTCVYNQVKLVAEYENHKDFIATDETPEYFSGIKQYDDNENYTISYGTENNKSKNSFDTTSTYYSILVLIAIVGGLIWWTRRR